MTPKYARLASRVLAMGLEREGLDRDGPPSGEPRTVARADRDRGIAAIEAAIRAKARARTRMRWLLGAGAAAAAVVCLGVGGVAMRHRVASAPSAGTAVIAANAASGSAPAPGAPLTVVGRSTGGDVTVSGPQSTDALAEGKPLAAGSRIVARSGGRALLAFSTGTQLTVEEGSDMTIVDQGATQVFALAGGALRADVAKLGEGQRFLVRTADAEVEVRGTSFRVSIARPDPSCGEGTVTRVAVYEGAVVVRRGSNEARVVAGEAWPSRCAEPAKADAPAPVVGTSSSALATHGRHSGPAHPSAARGSGATSAPFERSGAAGPAVTAAAPSVGAPGAASASSLAEQNDRFAEAIAAKRSGNASVAIARFERFLATYPQSPLGESASVERMKLLAATDPARGAAAARQYLARYPAGFARAEAEAIVAEHP